MYANRTDDLSPLEQQMKQHEDKAVGTVDGVSVKHDTQRKGCLGWGLQSERRK